MSVNTNKSPLNPAFVGDSRGLMSTGMNGVTWVQRLESVFGVFWGASVEKLFGAAFERCGESAQGGCTDASDVAPLMLKVTDSGV